MFSSGWSRMRTVEESKQFLAERLEREREAQRNWSRAGRPHLRDWAGFVGLSAVVVVVGQALGLF